MSEEYADFALRVIPVALKLREARYNKTGVRFTRKEVLVLLEMLQVIRKGP